MVDGEAVGAMALGALTARGAREGRAHVDGAAFLAEPVCSKPHRTTHLQSNGRWSSGL